MRVDLGTAGLAAPDQPVRRAEPTTSAEERTFQLGCCAFSGRLTRPQALLDE